MQFEVTSTYTRRITTRGAWCFWKRFAGRETAVGWAVALLATMVGEDGLVAGVGILGGLVGFAGTAGWFVVRARSLDLLGLMRSPVVEWTFSDDGIAMRSDLGNAAAKWRAVRRVWVFEDLWLVFFSRVSYATLPTDGVPPEVLRFLLRRASEAGAELRPALDETLLIDPW